jgi:hypothetical protein
MLSTEGISGSSISGETGDLGGSKTWWLCNNLRVSFIRFLTLLDLCCSTIISLWLLRIDVKKFMSQHKGEGGLSLGWLLPAPNRSGRPVAPTGCCYSYCYSSLSSICISSYLPSEGVLIFLGVGILVNYLWSNAISKYKKLVDDPRWH